MEVLRSNIHSINVSVCPGSGHLSSFFLPGGRSLPRFSARPPAIVNLKKKSANARGLPGGGGWAMLELTDAKKSG
jgi:hypothetical protein